MDLGGLHGRPVLSLERREIPIERRSPNPELVGRRGDGLPLGNQEQSFAQLFAIQSWRSTKCNAARFRSGHSCPCAFDDKRPLEVSHSAEDMQHELTRSRAHVYVFAHGLEPDPTFVEPSHRVR